MLGFPGSSVVKNPPANAGESRDVGLILGSRKSPGWGNGNSLQYSCLPNPMNRGAWGATVHGVTKNRTLCRVHHTKCWAAWITTWNQDCQEKYQLPQICRWYHSQDRKRRGTEELLEGERGEWKIWLKTLYLKNLRWWYLVPSFLANRQGKSRSSDRFYFLGVPKPLDDDCSHEIKRHSLEEKLWQI